MRDIGVLFTDIINPHNTAAVDNNGLKKFEHNGTIITDACQTVAVETIH